LAFAPEAVEKYSAKGELRRFERVRDWVDVMPSRILCGSRVESEGRKVGGLV
jgi:hypothetical protein